MYIRVAHLRTFMCMSALWPNPSELICIHIDGAGDAIRWLPLQGRQVWGVADAWLAHPVPTSLNQCANR